MRKTYRFSHKVVQGRYLYAHKIDKESISNKEGLKNMLNAAAKRFGLIDVTIKIYERIFFFFFMFREINPNELIETIQKNLSCFGEWDKDYIYSAVYDL